MLTTNRFFERLLDGKWHDWRNLKRVRSDYLEFFVAFLEENRFIEVNRDGMSVRLTPVMYQFLKKIRSIEEKETVQLVKRASRAS
jgi:hypothetical protein